MKRKFKKNAKGQLVLFMIEPLFNFREQPLPCNRTASSGLKQFKAIRGGNQTATQQQLEYMYNTTQ